MRAHNKDVRNDQNNKRNKNIFLILLRLFFIFLLKNNILLKTLLIALVILDKNLTIGLFKLFYLDGRVILVGFNIFFISISDNMSFSNKSSLIVLPVSYASYAISAVLS